MRLFAETSTTYSETSTTYSETSTTYSETLAQRIDQLEPKLLVDFCSRKASWHNDNAKYKQAFQGLVRAVVAASTQIRDINSVLCKSLAEGGALVKQAARRQQSQEICHLLQLLATPVART